MPPASEQNSAELLAGCQTGDEAAAAAVFARYAERLMRLAQSRLAARLATRVDPEDIVQSAYRSFFCAAREGRFTWEREGDLWRLLAHVTLHKLYRQAERHGAVRRSVDRELLASATDNSDFLAREPTPEQAAVACEQLEALLAELPAASRPIVELRLQGYEQREIAQGLGCSERTVRRALALAREFLLRQGGTDPSKSGPSSQGTRKRTKTPTARKRIGGELKWSDFTLLGQIGAGATGKVYRARRHADDRLVAVKFLKKSLVDLPHVADQFLREVELVKSLSHPGIVPIHGIGGTPGGGLFLVMELIDGHDLAQLRSCRSIQPSEAAAWIAAAARTVHFAHEHGIVHCDLKPSNLMLDQTGMVLVTDFGLAVHVADARSLHAVAGTPAFMAPEQVDRCWGEISPWTDVWGLGSVLYSLILGRPPHAGENVPDVLAQVVSGKPVTFTSDDKAKLGPELAPLCQRALAKPPAERFASAAELALALES
jgi:RNA polymerase sigma factor (sigma-70 family)